MFTHTRKHIHTHTHTVTEHLPVTDLLDDCRKRLFLCIKGKGRK